MELMLEELFELAETVSDTIGIPLEIKKETNGGWRASFKGISKRDNIFNVNTGSHDTIKEVIIAVLKAVKPERSLSPDREEAASVMKQIEGKI